MSSTPLFSLRLENRKGRTPRIRAVIEFVSECFRRLEAGRSDGRVTSGERPEWYERRFNRASSSVR